MGRCVCVVLGLAAGLAACIDAPLTHCGDTEVCLVAQLEACRGKAAGTSCSYDQLSSGLCNPALLCVPLGCGNAVVEANEACDDGNTVSGDGCTANCGSTEACGNGVVDVGEQCDCGRDESTRPAGCAVPNGDTPDAQCLTVCNLPRCGNGVVDPGEVCDDGNLISGDGCNSTCTSTGTCGNNTLDPGEQCDDGNLADSDDCHMDCQLPRCGDGVKDSPMEVCDDGNNISGDGCNANCQSDETCGNNFVDINEDCDDGNVIDHDMCQHNCKNQRCGDGIVDAIDDEECDDGNTDNTDGCPTTCKIAFCGDGFVQAGVEDCDDRNTFGNDQCPRTCLRNCGNGQVDPGEQCDDGNQVDFDFCSNECRLPCQSEGAFLTYRIGRTCYASYHYTSGVTWLEAEQACNSSGGHILSINSLVEQNNLPLWATYQGAKYSVWLGINDRATNNMFVWSDGSPVSFTNWAGTPNAALDCGYADSYVWQWATASCSQTRNVGVCEGDACDHDGVIDPGELCDDGNLDDTDTCTSWCTPAVCGDGAPHTGYEACDDGNEDDFDDCNTSCQVNLCGNRDMDPGEECDDGNPYDSDKCVRCKVAFCGDGFRDTSSEECDDGNGTNTDGCAGCQLAYCGDGFVQAGVEDCDDGNTDPSDGCERCKVATCGNGMIEPGERCDDHNTISGDGCSSDCYSTCGNATKEPWEYCEDGNLIDNDGCPADCMAGCGDGNVGAGEQCDDANAIETDFCTNDCQPPCGTYEPGVEALIQGANGNCYAVMSQFMMYAEAVQACEGIGGGIAVSDGNGELLVGNVIYTQYPDSYWIGVTEVTEGEFVWADGEAATVSNWADGQPDDSSTTGDCVVFGDQGLWSDEYCEGSHPFVCVVP